MYLLHLVRGVSLISDEINGQRSSVTMMVDRFEDGTAHTNDTPTECL